MDCFPLTELPRLNSGGSLKAENNDLNVLWLWLYNHPFNRQKYGYNVTVKISLCICVVLSWDELKVQQNLLASDYDHNE